MCGIVGYVGMRSAQQVLLDGLEKLEYRGYDSAGVALTQRDGIRVVKSKGRLSTLRSKLEELALPQSGCGIGHTRWATHGEPSDVNSHPHSTPRVSIVHNGIIENYGLLKERLAAKGYTFQSETDTEVLVKLIDSCYTGDPLVAALFAGVTWGFALALLYMRGSSSGGTDFLTMSIKVLRPHLSIGAVTGGIDLVVILLGWPVFGTVDSVLYGLVTTVITSLVIDKVMYGSSSSKMLTIITTKGQEIADEISRECERGSTMLKAIGTYTNTERQMLLCVCARPQVYRIRTAAYRIDPGCMVMVTEAGEVYGEGFIDPGKTSSFL